MYQMSEPTDPFSAPTPDADAGSQRFNDANTAGNRSNHHPRALKPELKKPPHLSAAEADEPDLDAMAMLDRGLVPVDLGLAGVYARTIYETSRSSRNYHDLAGLALFASAIQHRYLPMTWAPREKLRPNLYCCILGLSSFSLKSTALSKPHETMPWSEMAQCASLPGFFTEEGLYKELSEHPFGLIVKDEVGMLFASRERKHLESVIPFLTDAHGGWMYGKRLSKATYEAREVALTILGATTYSEFARTTRDSDWDSGWLVRWLYAVPDADYDPTADPRWKSDDDRARLDEVRRHLVELNLRVEGPMHAEQAALVYLREWRKALIRAAMQNEERHLRVDAVIMRYATYAWKFAMILSAARGDGETVTLALAQDACRLAENYMTNVHHLYQVQHDSRITGTLLNKALDVLNRDKAGLTRRDLGRLLNVNADVRDEIVERLQQIGVVAETRRGKTTIFTATAPRIPPQRLDTTKFA